VYLFWFWLIFDYLCTNHYCTSLTIFFNPLDACWLLARVHILVTCINCNDFSMGCCTWSRFLISSTRHNTYIISWFMANDNFFLLRFSLLSLSIIS
jgi:hypothetical protein